MLSTQEIFDKAAIGLLAQNAKSGDYGYNDDTPNTFYCKYRDDNGHKCGAGMLIDDEHYTPALEYKTVRYPDVSRALFKSGVPVAALALVESIQELHDSTDSATWRAGLTELAASFGLTMPER